MSARLFAGLGVGLVLLGSAVPASAEGTPAQRTWHGDQVRAPSAQSAGRGGSGVLVAVLDSWVDRGHKDFEGRVLAGADCAGGTCRAGAASADQCDHGTHVAGTIAASSYGVAPNARILPVRVLTHDAGTGECVGRPDDVAAGIRWAISQGARVLNLSLGPDVPGLSSSSSIPAAVREAAEAGAFVVFSAGNASVPVTDSYNGDAVIVAATGPSGRLASYSQRGRDVDLAAPGGEPEREDYCEQTDCITSLYPGSRYSVAAGTSMAAPHVSGIAALLLGQDPRRTRQQVAQRLTSTARPLSDAGSGLVDAAKALGVTNSAPPPQTSSPRSPSAEPIQVVRPRRPSRPQSPSAVPAPSPKPSARPVGGTPAASAVASPSASVAPSASPTPSGVLSAPVTYPALVTTAKFPPRPAHAPPMELVAVAGLLALGTGFGVARTVRR